MAYSKARAAEIKARVCTELADGKSLRTICTGKGMPSIETIRVWLLNDAAFAAQYARAREEQADFYADEIIDISDTEKDPQKAKVRIDARKWVASKLKPKKYGDKIELGHTGEVGVVTKVVFEIEDDADAAGPNAAHS